MPGLFITGTDTDVGKTWVTSILARDLVKSGRRPGVFKPACSGAEESDDGTLRWRDVEQLAEAAGVPERQRNSICPLLLKAPLAPPVAARLEKRNICLSLIQQAFHQVCEQHELVLVEGVGGLLCPLTDDETVADFAALTGFPLIIVARLGLGTINHTLLTVEAATHRALPVAGVVLNDVDKSDGSPDAETNVTELEQRLDCPLLGIVPFGADRVCLRDGRTTARIDWSRLAGSSS